MINKKKYIKKLSKVTKIKSRNPERSFKDNLENLVDDRITVTYRYGKFNGHLKDKLDQFFYIKCGKSGYPEGHADMIFKHTDVKNIINDDGHIEIILK